ncbi:hypothetical protein ABHF33_10515 [Chitinibacter sp. FCG-7]|uniref:Uncharacterized protein n=1 Tax=Chitinibacter mangrovi TaxID=3153927 RepID=A0AAU7F6M9_9NEIS
MPFAYDYLLEFQKQMQRGRCLHHSHGERCDKIIKAHSIQKSGQLSLIAENGHVYRLNNELAVLRKNNGIPDLKKIGIKQASTFLGFCKLHDNQLFEPIDKYPLEPTKEQIALYAFRCLCREYFVKENAVTTISNMTSHTDLNRHQLSFLKHSHLGHSNALANLQRHKSLFDSVILNSDFEQFEFICFTSSSPCQLQFSGVLYPDYDFEGKILQDLGVLTERLDLITFFSAPMENGWAFGFGWHVSSNKTCFPFIQSLANIVANGKKLEDALLRFVISCCENHAMRISWWDGLDADLKAQIIERMHIMTHPHIQVPVNYLMAGCEGVANWNFEYIHTSLPSKN